jgi:hypothetical protein
MDWIIYFIFVAESEIWSALKLNVAVVSVFWFAYLTVNLFFSLMLLIYSYHIIKTNNTLQKKKRQITLSLIMDQGTFLNRVEPRIAIYGETLGHGWRVYFPDIYNDVNSLSQ